MNRRALPVALTLAGLTWLAAAPAGADTRIEKDLKLAPGGEFRIETDLGAVTVTGSPDSGAHIVVTSRRKDLDDLLTFRWEEGAGSATVIAKKKHPSPGSRDHGDQRGVRDPGSDRDAALDRHLGRRHQDLGTCAARRGSTPRAAASRSPP